MSASVGKSQCFNAHDCSGGFPRFFSLLPGRTGGVRTSEVCLSSHSEGASDLSLSYLILSCLLFREISPLCCDLSEYLVLDATPALEALAYSGGIPGGL